MIKSFFVLFGVILCVSLIVSLIVSLTPSAYAFEYLDNTSRSVTYDENTNEVTVSWDLGDNDYRTSCNLKVEYYNNNVIGYDPDSGDFGLTIPNGNYELWHFNGTDIDNVVSGGMVHYDIPVNESEINCQDSLTFTLDDDDWNFHDMYWTFYEYIDPNYKHLVEVQEGREYILKQYNLREFHEIQIFISADWIIDTPTCGELTDRDLFSFHEFHWDLNGYKTTLYDNVAGCWIQDTVLTLQEKSGGSGNEWKTRPTFGIGHEVPTQLVTCGFTHADTCYDITDNWHTDFERKEIKVGETHTFILKAYFPKVMKVMGFNLGIESIGKGYDSELQIDTFYDYQGNMIVLKINQDSKIIDPKTLHVYNFKVSCDETDTQNKCDAVSYTMTFLEPLQYDIMAMQGTDQKNRSQWTYLNEGFPVNGKSLNPMKTDNISGTEKYEGIIKVTQKEKYSDIWVSQDGREFQRNSSGSFVWINQTFEKSPSPEMSVMTRTHSEHYKLFEIEQNKALLVFDSTKLISLTPDSWSYDGPKSTEQKQAELDIKIQNEIDRITPFTKDYTLNQYLYQKDSYDHWNHFSDMTVSQINQMDLEKKLQLQEELYQQRLAEQQKYRS